MARYTQLYYLYPETGEFEMVADELNQMTDILLQGMTFRTYPENTLRRRSRQVLSFQKVISGRHVS